MNSRRIFGISNCYQLFVKFKQYTKINTVCLFLSCPFNLFKRRIRKNAAGTTTGVYFFNDPKLHSFIQRGLDFNVKSPFSLTRLLQKLKSKIAFDLILAFIYVLFSSPLADHHCTRFSPLQHTCS